MSRCALFGVVAAAAAALLGSTAAAQSRGPDLSQIREYTVQNLVVPHEPGAPFSVGVVVDGQPRTLTLNPRSLRAPGFRMLVVSGGGVLREEKAPPPATYQGAVEGLDGVRVAASVLDGGLHALLDTPELGGFWAIEPLRLYRPGAPREAHVVYATEALPPVEGLCGVNELRVGSPLPPAGGGTDAVRVCQLAIDTDFEFYQANGSNQTNCINDIELIINGCDVIYRRDVEVTFDIVHTIIRSSVNDPYTTTNPHTLLDQVANHWFSQQGGVSRDLVHHMSGRDFDGNIIGVAFLNGVCSTQTGYGTVQRPGLSTTARIGLSAHEMGHNFSAGHCDASPDCRIMCSGLGGCTGNLSSFGPTEQAQIEAFAGAARCLSIETLPLPFEEPWATTTIDAGRWPDVTGAVVSATPLNPPSPPRAALLNLASSLASARINLPLGQFTTGLFCSYWTEHRFVEAGDTLRVEFFNTLFNRWDPLETIASDGVDQARFVPSEFRLPAQAFGASFRLRFSTTGTDLDLWYVDDVYVGEFCLTDLDRSRTLDVFDFLAFQNFYAALDSRADWNRDGSFDIFDFLEYQNDYATGCY